MVLQRARAGRLCLALAALPLLSACRPATLASADREVYGGLDRRRSCVPEVAGSLDLDQAEGRARATRADALRAGAARHITLRQALQLAARASRDIRAEREEVYLRALDLSTVRHDFQAIPFASGGGALEAIDGSTSVRGDLDAGFSKVLERGGSIALTLASDFLDNLTGNPLGAAQSILALDLVLPLLRGSGLAARERLTQAERDVIYALRSYAFFQQRFAVDSASAFYRALEARDTWQNEERTYASLRGFEERQRAHGREGAGRIPEFQVEQTRQDTLRSDDRRQQARVSYEGALDDLKLLLGLPVLAAVEPDDADLEALARRGPVGPPYLEAQAQAEAARRRLDLRNARDQVADARRKAEVARDGLGSQLDLELGGDLTTPSTQPLDLAEASRRLSVGLRLDLPLDRTPERNLWRAALIQAVRAWRGLEALEDRVAVEVRSALRSLEEAARSHAIQLEGVRLAERRVESTRLLLEAGQAQTRDVLDAENDLVEARNALTSALVDHAVARLELERAVGTLRVDGEGGYSELPPLVAHTALPLSSPPPAWGPPLLPPQPPLPAPASRPPPPPAPPRAPPAPGPGAAPPRDAK